MNPASDRLKETLMGLSKTHLLALHRIAKDPKKGVRPFFVDPYNMIALRRAMEEKHD